MAWHDDLTAVATERGSALVGYAYLLTGDQARAQDLVQEALVRTWARPRRLANAAATEAYVRRTVLNVYLDEHRRESVWRRRRHLAALPEATSPGAGAAIDETIAVQAALTGLSPRERACVVLRFYDDLTVPAVAARLGISSGAAKRYLSDAMGKLSDALGPLDEQHDLEDVAVELGPSGDAKGGRS